MPAQPKLVILEDGRAIWLYPDGMWLPAIAGGQTDDDDDPADQDDDEDDEDDPSDDDEDDEDEDEGPKLGEKGQKALKREREARREARRENRELKRKNKELETRLERLERKGSKPKSTKKPDTGEGPDREAIEEELREKVRTEERERANREILKAHLRSEAKGMLIDPDDAPRLIDLDDLEDAIDDRGRVNAKLIRRAVKDLVKDKPHLAPAKDDEDEDEPTGKKTEPKSARGSADGGARKPKPKSGGADETLVGAARLRVAYGKSGSKKK